MTPHDAQKLKLELRLENLFRNYRGCVAAQRHIFETLIAETKRDLVALEHPLTFDPVGMEHMSGIDHAAR